MQFSLLNLKMNGTCDSMTTPTSPNYCCYTILWKLNHQKCNITVGYYQRKLHQMLHQSEPGSLCAVNLLIWVVIQQCMYETKIRDINDLRKRVMQTWFWLWAGHHRRCDWPVAWPSEIIMRVLVMDVLNTCSDVSVHLYDSADHFMKLSM